MGLAFGPDDRRNAACGRKGKESNMFRAAVLAITILSVVPVHAAGADADGTAVLSSADPIQLATDTDWSLPPVHVGSNKPTRGAVLPALYVSLAALNVYDAYSTRSGLAKGAVEANPMMRGVAGNGAALWAVKGAATGVSIYLAERLWRKHRRMEAVAVMLVSNGIMAAVTARNASVLGQVR
jgi:hypothetical protein